MTNLIVGVILLVILGLAVRYLVKAKKSGARCIGCDVSGGCGCGCESERETESKCQWGCGK